MIGDETGLCRMVLWEDVQSLEARKTYDLVDVTVQKYGMAKYGKFVVSYRIVFKQVEVSTISALVESTDSWLHADT